MSVLIPNFPTQITLILATGHCSEFISIQSDQFCSCLGSRFQALAMKPQLGSEGAPEAATYNAGGIILKPTRPDVASPFPLPAVALDDFSF
ncbi:hypothetical protein CDL15_Pgr010412 [Punica granatum]|uniref:Uncharacterized protein n=1 Tax=Punica granatum TaxID=22663 RepID=A0A218W374_PUNGR|nr:hypothetical protein CDL15_Pgr010412 [Punica granatum]